MHARTDVAYEGFGCMASGRVLWSLMLTDNEAPAIRAAVVWLYAMAHLRGSAVYKLGHEPPMAGPR